MRSFKSFFTHLVCFAMSFSIEVTVHAKSLIAEEPIGCAATENVCAIENSGPGGYEIKMGSSSVVLDENSAAIRQSKNEIRLVKGTAWVRGSESITVKSEFGEVRSDGSGEFWVSHTKESITASAVTTTVLITARGSKETLNIDPGLQNTVGAVGFDGRGTTGIPYAIPFKDHLIRWARLYHGPKKDFEDQVESFHRVWAAASASAAALNKDLYDRKIASVEEAKSKRAAKAAKIESENAKLRAMFRERSLNGI